jgi:hypothetical protein
MSVSPARGRWCGKIGQGAADRQLSEALVIGIEVVVRRERAGFRAGRRGLRPSPWLGSTGPGPEWSLVAGLALALARPGAADAA